MQQQSDRVNDTGQRQKETDQVISAIARKLRSMKMAVEDQLIAMEGSIVGLTRQLCTEVAESQELLKHEHCEDLLEDLSAASGLHPTVFQVLPTAGTLLDVVGQVMGRVRNATTTRGTPINQQRPKMFKGKIPWDTYWTQFNLLADMNRWSNVDKATYLAISLRDWPCSHRPDQFTTQETSGLWNPHSST